ncbi:FliM/FliN family flagellar motor switch protein [Iodobacter ciconiae]|uniref:Surface presentation of antigens protein SpaO n=1 Tax=Iodobacter ciconiae TaxID=2496266 RepID=A0A3S8ZQY3_9NEIS|nr:FliM/FliN family flagellar motor switch protein [Iodobacter ciconiae]AZN35896.1 hypothetical protein EJO50_05010 [Iodobacter ciconiae]
MSGLELRQLASKEHAWQQAQQCWLARGLDVSFSLPEGACYAVSADNGRWQGLLNLREWLAAVSPALAGLLGSGSDDRLLRDLFMATARPLEFTVAELAYEHLQLGYKRLTPGPEMLCLQTSQGRVWLTGIPEVKEGRLKLDLHYLFTLPLRLVFEVGRSPLSQRVKAQLEAGDVLLIIEETFSVKSCGARIGRYRQSEDGIMIEKDEQAAVPAKIPDALAELPLCLEFILQQSTISVSGLGDLYRGQLLPLLPDVEKRIEVKANGVLIGRGELVRIDGQLGVELSEICHEVLHVK